MKTIVFILLFVCVFISPVKATGQVGERIIIGKDTLELLNLPIEWDSIISRKIDDRITGISSTVCWRGYIGEWELKGNTLYLNQVFDSRSFNQKQAENQFIGLNGIFDKYIKRGRIKASWVTGELRVVGGNCIHYIHSGFRRTYEYETFYQVKNGVVKGKKTYHNSCHTPVYSLDDVCGLLMERFDGDQFPELENKHLRVSFSVMPKADGALDSLYSASIYVFSPDTNRLMIENYDHPYMKAFIGYLKEIPDWEALQKNGQICPTQLYSVPLWKGKGNRALYAREQLSDSIQWKGSYFSLLNFPLQYKMSLYTHLRAFLKKGFDRQCSRGYVAQWLLKDGFLYLKQIRDYKDKSLIPLEFLFPGQESGEPVKAIWYSGVLRLVNGNIERNDSVSLDKYEREVCIEVKEGKVVDTQFMSSALNYIR